jgi:hypothetical protein
VSGIFADTASTLFVEAGPEKESKPKPGRHASEGENFLQKNQQRFSRRFEEMIPRC